MKFLALRVRLYVLNSYASIDQVGKLGLEQSSQRPIRQVPEVRLKDGVQLDRWRIIWTRGWRWNQNLVVRISPVEGLCAGKGYEELFKLHVVHGYEALAHDRPAECLVSLILEQRLIRNISRLHTMVDDRTTPDVAYRPVPWLASSNPVDDCSTPRRGKFASAKSRT